MSRHPVTIDGDTSTDRAVHLLANRRTTHLVVLDADGAVLGVLDRRDLVAGLCRPDAEIEADAVATIAATVPSGGGTIRVRVRDGVVHLTGALPGQHDGSTIRDALRMVPGVIDVGDDITHPDTATADRRR